MILWHFPISNGGRPPYCGDSMNGREQVITKCGGDKGGVMVAQWY